MTAANAVSRKLEAAEWGDGVVDALDRHLARSQPGLSGFNRRNLFRMRQFYETDRDDQKVSPLVAALNNLVEQYLVFAEGHAMRPIPMHMRDWIAKLDGFLHLNERGILTHAGRISHELALGHAEQEYDSFHRRRIADNAELPDDFEKSIKALPASKPRGKRKRGAK